MPHANASRNSNENAGPPSGPDSSTPAKIDEPFSVRSEEKRQHEKQQGDCKSELPQKRVTASGTRNAAW